MRADCLPQVQVSQLDRQLRIAEQRANDAERTVEALNKQLEEMEQKMQEGDAEEPSDVSSLLDKELARRLNHSKSLPGRASDGLSGAMSPMARIAHTDEVEELSSLLQDKTTQVRLATFKLFSYIRRSG